MGGCPVTGFAEVNGTSLRYDLRPGSGAPVVLIHEMGGALESWDEVVPHLPNPVLRLDLRGFGLSEKPRGPQRIAQLAGDVLDLMTLVGFDRAMITGCAVGAAVALACGASGRAVAILALAPATGVAPERQAAVRGLAEHLRQGGLRDFVLNDTLPRGWPAALPRPDAAFARFRALQLGCDPHVLAETYLMLCDQTPEALMRGVTCPVTLVAGRHDAARPPEIVAAIARQIGARFRAVDSGHFMALQSPELVAGLIREATQPG